MLASVDSALKAWTACTPNYKLPAQALPALVPRIASCIPGGHATTQSARARRLRELFEVDSKQSDGRSMFLQMVKEHEGEVHFLYFWRAFSKAARVVGVEEGHGVHESLLIEFETLRDRMLRLLDAQVSEPDRQDRPPTMSAGALSELVVSTASMSAVPTFWHRCLLTLHGSKDDPRQLQLEQLTMVMLAWLWDAVTWQPPMESQVAVSMRSRCEDPPAPDKKRFPVRLHIYDVSHENTVQQINQVFASKDFPLKMGGAFHVGVEVNDSEWCYGASLSDTKPGVGCVLPRKHPNHHFRQTVKLGYTTLTGEEIASLISDLIEEYPGTDYDLLARNCTHFADDFCQRLGVGPIPGWIRRFADIGVHVVNMLQTATTIRTQVGGALRQAQKEFHNGAFTPLPGNSCWQPPRGISYAEIETMALERTR
jgi:hypothetical protein